MMLNGCSQDEERHESNRMAASAGKEFEIRNEGKKNYTWIHLKWNHDVINRLLSDDPKLKVWIKLYCSSNDGESFISTGHDLFTGKSVSKFTLTGWIVKKEFPNDFPTASCTVSLMKYDNGKMITWYTSEELRNFKLKQFNTFVIGND